MIVLPELIIQQYIENGMEYIRNNLWIISQLFVRCKEGILANKYGDSYIEKITKYFNETHIPIFVDFVSDKQKYPSVLIRNKLTKESEGNEFLGNMVEGEFSTKEEYHKINKFKLIKYDGETGNCLIDNKELKNIYKNTLIYDEGNRRFYYICSAITPEGSFSRFNIKEFNTEEIVKRPSADLWVSMYNVSQSMEIRGSDLECNIDILIYSGSNYNECLWIKTLIWYILKSYQNRMLDDGLRDSTITLNSAERKQEIFPNLIFGDALSFSCRYTQCFPIIEFHTPPMLEIEQKFD